MKKHEGHEEVREHGRLYPILVTKVPGGGMQVCGGHHEDTAGRGGGLVTEAQVRREVVGTLGQGQMDSGAPGLGASGSGLAGPGLPSFPFSARAPSLIR